MCVSVASLGYCFVCLFSFAFLGGIHGDVGNLRGNIYHFVDLSTWACTQPSWLHHDQHYHQVWFDRAVEKENERLTYCYGMASYTLSDITRD